MQIISDGLHWFTTCMFRMHVTNVRTFQIYFWALSANACTELYLTFAILYAHIEDVFKCE